MKKLASKALVIAIAAVIVAGATAAFAKTDGSNNGKTSNDPQGWAIGQQFAGPEGVAGQRGFAPGQGEGKMKPKPRIEIPGIIKSVSDTELVVKLRKGQITVDVDGDLRIIEVRHTIAPVGVKEGQHVLLIAVRDGNSLEIKAVVVHADKPDRPQTEDSGTPSVI